VFQINEIGEGHALKYIGLELLQKYDIINKYKVGLPIGPTQHFLFIAVTFDETVATTEEGIGADG